MEDEEIECPNCHGAKVIDLDGEGHTKTCGVCEGKGVVIQCNTCEGAGWVDDPSDGGTMTCEDCDGEGHTSKEEE